MAAKCSKSELNKAVIDCLEYLWPSAKQKTLVNNYNLNIIDIMQRLKNSDGSEFTHLYPYILIFKITSGCNLRCKHCFYHEDTAKYLTDNDLKEEELFSYLKYFVEKINIVSCTLTGGEIFTVPYLMRFIEYLKSHNIFLELLTNGTMITEENANKLAKLLNPKTDSIQISLEGPRDVNDFVRGNGVFDKAKRSIKLLTAHGLKVCVSMTVNALNADKIDKMYDICRALKIYRLNIGRFNLCDDAQRDLSPNTDDIIISTANTIKKFKEHKDLRIKIRALKVFDFLEYDIGRKFIDKMLETETHVLAETNLHCRPRNDQVTLFATGDISLCYNCENDEMIIGNLKDDSFENIWKHKQDKLMFQTRELNSTCKLCKYVSLCKGGCPINAYNQYKNINAPDGNCKYAQSMIANGIWNQEN